MSDLASIKIYDDPTAAFRSARDVLFAHRYDLDAARRNFRWPHLTSFNWALDWFDVVAMSPERRDRPALRVLEPERYEGTETTFTFGELSERSAQVANWLGEIGVRRGDPLMLMLDGRAPLWLLMLAATKLGAIIVPTATQLGPDALAERLRRASVRHVVAGLADTAKFAGLSPALTRIVSMPEDTGPGRLRPPDGWLDLASAQRAGSVFRPDRPTPADAPLLRYFTSGTTSRPKLVEHTHASYPVGQLTTMYLVGQRPDDVHMTVASPGWAKHACGNVFAPWAAEACVLALARKRRFEADALLDALVQGRVTTFCAPPTVWNMLIQRPLRRWKVALREAMSAGEPLSPEVSARVLNAWGVTVRDAYGQTEATGLIGTPPGLPARPGSMGRPLPGYTIALADGSGEPADEGEIRVSLTPPPLGLMSGYVDPRTGSPESPGDAWYRTGDIARRDTDGYFTYVGREDDVFKSSNYRISPFELESVLLEHASVAEAAVVPAPDPRRTTVPKAYVGLAAGIEPSSKTALELFSFLASRLAPYQRIRRIQFIDLPKNTAGKIERSLLRESGAHAWPDSVEFREEDHLPR